MAPLTEGDLTTWNWLVLYLETIPSQVTKMCLICHDDLKKKTHFKTIPKDDYPLALLGFYKHSKPKKDF